jgi:hypothetical protein
MTQTLAQLHPRKKPPEQHANKCSDNVNTSAGSRGVIRHKPMKPQFDSVIIHFARTKGTFLLATRRNLLDYEEIKKCSQGLPT